MTVSDAEAVAALQVLCFPPPFPSAALFVAANVRRHVEVFPAGQFVALAGGVVVGSATNMSFSRATWEAHRPWDETIGGLDLSGHQPVGEVLFGVDISVAPDWRRAGVGRRLYGARFDLVRSGGYDLFATVCRMPDFAGSGVASVDAYAREVVAGRLVDRTLTPLLRLGLTYCGVIEGYMDDEESGDAGAVLEWRP